MSPKLASRGTTKTYSHKISDQWFFVCYCTDTLTDRTINYTQFKHYSHVDKQW